MNFVASCLAQAKTFRRRPLLKKVQKSLKHAFPRLVQNPLFHNRVNEVMSVILLTRQVNPIYTHSSITPLFTTSPSQQLSGLSVLYRSDSGTGANLTLLTMGSAYTHCYVVFTKVFGHSLETCMFSVLQVKVRSPVRPILVHKQCRDGEGKFCVTFQRQRFKSSVAR